MIALEKIKAFNSQASDSYHKQRNFIKKVLSGRITTCPNCQQVLSITMSQSDSPSIICCVNKCTDIELDCS